MTATQPGTRTAGREWAAGLMVFGAIMLMLAGILAIFRGISAIAQDDVFVTTPNYVFQFDLTGWGWIHLILGAVAVIVSFGLFQAATWARVGGVTIAGLIIIANFLSLPYYPVWSVLMIAFSGFIIWALCVARKEDIDEPLGRMPRDV
ncbi:DUF7144 family membrane protein [Streptomyces chromofuscus]|uniref:DUF7144 domain-containing protein n=1 Tax=Streptomyces chromofuscus TaxID=42881 RepID=A0A7M2T9Y5_STRCW|nr:hypothetical protein [Streptomyces chromofuscus]QOV45054.1 hypothetical protein IPT68_03420 [Streptomyces chromofuscus]GGT28055.1 hypothetical protein GCM10010254_55880 [Streptomyces chromofuscus]